MPFRSDEPVLITSSTLKPTAMGIYCDAYWIHQGTQELGAEH